MIKASYVVALCVAAMAITNGCVTEDKKVADSEIVVGGGQCGSRVCTGKTFCCNASCGICAPIGGGCTQQACLTADDGDDDNAAAAADADELVSTPQVDDDIVIGPRQCGKATCTGNTHCCNASCGTCVGPGGECTQQICQPTD